MILNTQIKSRLLGDFEKRLKTELSSNLYSFIANVRLDRGESFHDAVDAIFDRDGARGLRSFFDEMIELLGELHAENKEL